MSTAPRPHQPGDSSGSAEFGTADPFGAPLRALTPLIGREREVALVHAMLGRPGTRLLTLSGPGGIGKTRLALEVAANLAERDAGRVVFVPLAQLPDPGLVALTISDALGIHNAEPARVRDILVAALRDAPVTLVLDNFEHLLDAAPLVTDLLTACPDLTVIVTSRSLLRVDGEQVVPVPPLALPDPAMPLDLVEIATFPSVRLFVDRARAVSGSFDLNATTAPVALEICRRLDGIPLAIELAAARANHLPLPTLRDRLDRPLQLLTQGGRDRPARMQTLRAAIGWSYDLLTPDEQRLFRQLAVFTGGCSLTMVEALCPQGDGFDLLTSLVDKNLLVREPAASFDAEPRFTMLETIREFGYEQLHALGEAVDARRIHAMRFLELAEQLEMAGYLPDGQRYLATLEAEHDNLQAALTWLDETGEAEDFLRMAGALTLFWYAHSHYRIGRDWLERALDHAPAASQGARAKGLIGLGALILFQGDRERASTVLETGLALLRREEMPIEAGIALTVLAATASSAGDHDRASRLLDEALALVTPLDDSALTRSVLAIILANLSVSAYGLGRLDLARSYTDRALAIRRHDGNIWGMAHSLVDLADLAIEAGQHLDALNAARESLELSVICHDQRTFGDAMQAIASVAAAWRQPAIAAKLYGAAEKCNESIGTVAIQLVDVRDAGVEAIRTCLGETAFRTAWEEGRALSNDAIFDLAASLSEPAGQRASPESFGLTRREIEVLRLVAAGEPDRAIADRLFISVRTVEHHVARIFSKIGVHARGDAASAAREAGIIEPEATPQTPPSTN